MFASKIANAVIANAVVHIGILRSSCLQSRIGNVFYCRHEIGGRNENIALAMKQAKWCRTNISIDSRGTGSGSPIRVSAGREIPRFVRIQLDNIVSIERFQWVPICYLSYSQIYR